MQDPSRGFPKPTVPSSPEPLRNDFRESSRRRAEVDFSTFPPLSGRDPRKVFSKPISSPPALSTVDMPSASGRRVKEKARKKGRREMNGYGIETYADLAKTVGGMVLANEMAHRPLELVSGDFAPWDEIFQWYIISYPDFLMEHTDEPVFHDEELDLYVWGITHFGTGWDCVPAPEIH